MFNATFNNSLLYHDRDRRGRDRMVVGFTTTYAISAYHHWCCEFESRSGRCVLDTTLCDKACQWLATGRWFSPVSSSNKTDRHNIAEILLTVALNTIKQTNILDRGSQFHRRMHPEYPEKTIDLPQFTDLLTLPDQPRSPPSLVGFVLLNV